MSRNEQELSERDLLIRLQSQIEDFKSYTREKFEAIEKNLDGLSELKTKVAVLEEKIMENTKFRLWIYGSIAAGVSSILIQVFKLLN